MAGDPVALAVHESVAAGTVHIAGRILPSDGPEVDIEADLSFASGASVDGGAHPIGPVGRGSHGQ